MTAEVTALRHQAEELFRAGDLGGADAAFRDIGDKHPDQLPLTLIFRARIAAKSGRTEDACDHFLEHAAAFGLTVEGAHFLIRSFVSRGLLGEAQETLEKLSEIEPDDPDLPQLSDAVARLRDRTARLRQREARERAIDLFASEDWERADEAFAELDSSKPEQRRIAQVYRARIAINRDRAAEARSFYDQCSAEFGMFPEAASFLANLHLETGNLAQIDSVLERLTLESPEGAQDARSLRTEIDNKIRLRTQQEMVAERNLAFALFDKKEWGAAEQAFVKLAEKYPEQAALVSTYRGRIAVFDRRQSDAACHFLNLLGFQPQNFEAAMFLTRYLILAEDLFLAPMLQQRLIEYQPDSHLIQSLESHFLEMRGDHDEAISVLRSAIMRWPEQADLALQLTDVLNGVGRFEEAIEILDTLIAKGQTNQDLHFRKANIFVRMRDWKAAIATCEEGLALDSRNVILWRLAIQCLQNINETEELERFSKKALEHFSGTDQQSQIGRATVYLARKEFDHAIDVAERNLEKESSQHEFNVILARALEAKGDWRQALSIYKSIPYRRAEFAKDLDRMQAAIKFVGAPAKPGLLNWVFGQKTAPSGHFPEAIFETACERYSGQRYEPQSGVMHVTSSLGPGGAERQLAAIAIAQKQNSQGLQPKVVAKSLTAHDNRDFFKARIEEGGVTVACLDEAGNHSDKDVFDRAGTDLAEIYSLLEALPADSGRIAAPLYREVLANKPAVLHLWQDTTCIIGCLVGILAGTPRIIVSTRSTRPTGRQRARRYLAGGYRTFLRQPHISMINNSRNGARDYQDWLGRPDYGIRAVPNGYDFNQILAHASKSKAAAIRADLGCGEETILFGGVMRLSAEKQPDIWLETAIELKRILPDSKYVLVGSGPMEEALNARIEETGLEDSIKLVGSRSPVEPWMLAMDLLFLCSQTEGLPNVLIEAQALGTPVASTDVGGASETFLSGATGILIADKTSPAEIAAQLAKDLSDKAAMSKMGERAREFVTDNFSMESVLETLQQIYTAKK
jgi:glycosyltransferase involved in cell wall biosynthesis/predicted Zn-dependent protease